MKKFIKILIIILIVLLVLVGGFFAVLTIAEYKPDPVEQLEISGSAQKKLSTGDTLNVVSWNIGYGCLGEGADFFMDGGSSVYTADKEEAADNLSKISDKLTELKPDIILLQEVDLNSSRSYGVNQSDYLLTSLNKSETSESLFGYNFKSLYVPYPMPPIGHVESGILTISDYDIDKSERVSLPCPFTWPVSTVNLKRCLTVSRLPIEDSDKELVLINLHLEAYDDGEGKIEQTKQLKELLKQEYDKGNYVIAGGDFNQSFSYLDLSDYALSEDAQWIPGLIETDEHQDNYSWLMDTSAPSCRSLETAYAGKDRADFDFYVIDGFIVSDNLTVNSMKTIDLDFKNSDHNPTQLSVTIK